VNVHSQKTRAAPARLDTATRRRQIAEAALDIVSREGMKGLRIAALARRIGVVPSAVYRHFRGKEEVVRAILDLVRWRLAQNVEEARRETDDPVERIHALLRLQVRVVRESLGLPRVLFAEEVTTGKDRRNLLKYFLGDFLGDVEGLFRDGQHAGRIRRDVGAREFAVMFLGLFQPSALLWHTTGGSFDAKRQAEKTWRVFREGIRPSAQQRPGAASRPGRRTR
jgi:AcrR family transcriptional regulator